MEHISDFKIHKFRGLRDLKIEKLGQINLFVGNNNSGKTSVLEAASIFCEPFNWRRWYDVASQRESAGLRLSTVDRLIWLFPQEAVNDRQNASSKGAEISLSASGSFQIEELSASYERFTEIMNVTRSSVKLEDGAEEREIEAEGVRINVFIAGTHLSLFGKELPAKETLTFTDRSSITVSKQSIPTLPVQLVNQLSHRTGGLTSALWSDVVEANLKSETIELMRFFDPAIQDVDYIAPTERRQLLSVKHRKLGRAPLPTFGDGLRRVFTLATTIPRVRNGLLLVDELETAIHTKALEKTFDWLVKACIRNNIQLLATTHSLEALDAVLEVSRERADLVVYRLQQDKEQTNATRFDKEMTLRLREELGMELRY